MAHSRENGSELPSGYLVGLLPLLMLSLLVPAVTLSGINPIDDTSSGIFTQVTSRSSGSAGNVFIETKTLSLTDGAVIGSGTFSEGDVGNITVRASDAVLLSGSNPMNGFPSRISTASSGSGKGGDIVLNARAFQLLDSGEMTAESSDVGNAGLIRIAVLETILIDQSEIKTSASKSEGGDIDIAANFLELRDSQVITSVGEGIGQGGNIIVDTNLGLLERSEIQADAFGGPGGNITIRADGFIADVGSVISASSAQSVDGTVSIQGLADLSGSLTPLDPNFASTANLVARCADRWQGGELSRFTDAGRDGLPPKPGGLLPSPSGMAAAVAPPARQQAALLSEGQPRPASTLTAWHRDCVR